MSLILNTSNEAYDFAAHVVVVLEDHGALLSPDDAERVQGLLRDELEGRELASDVVYSGAARAVAERLFRVTPGTTNASVENATRKLIDAIDAVIVATLESMEDIAADAAVDAATAQADELEQILEEVSALLISAGVLWESEAAKLQIGLAIDLATGVDAGPASIRAARAVLSRRTGYGPGSANTTAEAENVLQRAILVALTEATDEARRTR